MSDPELIKWFVEELHYPFDVDFEALPPIDHDQLADYWNEHDGWELTQEEARSFIRGEVGLD